MRAYRFRFRSKSDKGLKWTAHVMAGRGVCNCRGFREWDHCRHVKKGLEMANEVTALVPATIETAPTTTLPSSAEYQMMMLIAQNAGSGRGLVPASIKTPEQAFAVILAGWELGVPPITALRHISVIHGRTEPDAQLKMAMVAEAEPDAEFRFPVRTKDVVKVELWRHGNLACEVTYTMDDAKQGGCFKPNRSTAWTDHPLDMLTWAAIHRVTRLGAPDIINAVTARGRMASVPFIDPNYPMKVETTALDVPDEVVEEFVEEVPDVEAAEISPDPAEAPTCEHQFKEETSGAVVCKLCGAHMHDLEAEEAAAKGRSS